jgi:hypothetical protein
MDSTPGAGPAASSRHSRLGAQVWRPSRGPAPATGAWPLAVGARPPTEDACPTVAVVGAGPTLATDPAADHLAVSPGAPLHKQK